jgi:hypothetical protein
MSRKIEALRQNPGISGSLLAVLEDLESRVVALEQHGPMLDDLRPEFLAMQERKAQWESEAAALEAGGIPPLAGSAPPVQASTSESGDPTKTGA